MVRSENCFLKVCKIKDLGLGEVMLKVRVLVVYTTCDSANLLKNQALTDFML